MKLIKSIKLTVLILIFLLISSPIFGAVQEVVTLGNDISAAQKQEMINYFGASSSVKTLTVQNYEERQQLKGRVSDSAIGSKAISCAYVKIGESGSGINVSSKNITLVTDQAYANALVTAGIKDAEIKAAAPFPVSGTAALTGLFKAYEEATGKPIPEKAKEVSTQELADTTNIGKETNNPEAVSQLMQNLKEKVIEGNITDPQDLKQLIKDEAEKLGLKLTDEQIDKIISLLLKIKDLNIDVSVLQKQLGDYLNQSKVQDIWLQVKQFVNSLWLKITEML